MRILFMIIFLDLGLLLQAQTKNDVQFLILNGDNKTSLIQDSEIYLIIIGNNYSNGPEHEFKNGMLFLHDVPTGANIRLRIRSKLYIYKEGELSVNVGKSANNSNAVSLYLFKLTSNTLILRGKVTEKQFSSSGISRCQVEINIDKAQKAYTVLTDSLGYFIFELREGINYYPSKFTISLHKPGYIDKDYFFFIEKDSINTLSGLVLEKKDVTRSRIKILGPPSMLKTAGIHSTALRPTNVDKGFLEFEAFRDSVLPSIDLIISCRFCEELNRSYEKNVLLDSTPTINLGKLLKYNRPIFSFIAGLNNTFLLTEKFKNKISLFGRIGAESYFSINKRFLGIGVSIFCPGMRITTNSNYSTLSGQKNNLHSNFRLAGSEFWVNYFFGNPKKAQVIGYSSILTGVISQRFISNQNDSLIQEEMRTPKRWYVGFRGGLRYNFSAHLTVGVSGQLIYYPLVFTNYQFNYFGRADLIVNLRSLIAPGLGIFVLLNLLNPADAHN